LLHCYCIGTLGHWWNSPRVLHYPPWSHSQDLYQSQEPYLCKFQYWLCPLLAIDSWGIWTGNCLPSWSAQYCCQFPKLSSHLYWLFQWD
jgi:hypothetical protein